MTTLKSVRATLNYTVDNGIPPDYYFYEPVEPVTPNPPGTDPHEVDIHDGWPRVDSISLDREGFALKPFTAEFDAYHDDAAIHSRFYPQVVEFVKQHTGAQRVEVFDHTIRKRLPPDLKQQTAVQRPAVLLVHSDYTVASGPQRVRDIVPNDADQLLTAGGASFTYTATGERLTRTRAGVTPGCFPRTCHQANTFRARERIRPEFYRNRSTR